MKKDLYNYIDSVKSKPFKWGEHDCLKFTGNCIKANTGINHNDKFPCSGKAEAIKFLRGYGGLDLFLDTLFSRKPVNQAKIGDIVTIKTGGVISTGVCLGGVSALVTKEGLTMQPTLNAIDAWSAN